MSLLFEPTRLASLSLRNRFVHSATFEAMTGLDGAVTDSLVARYRRLARGDVGLIVSGHLSVHPRGRAFLTQTNIDRDELVPGLRRLASAVTDNGGRVLFQLAHGGRQASRKVTGAAPLAPSSHGRDPASLNKPKEMTESDIEEVIVAFGEAARRSVEAGADGVQLHAAHGYLLSEFVSPFFNRRSDAWGGSAEKRFRLLKEVFLAVRRQVGDDVPVLVKLNGCDHTPRQGMTPQLAATYAGWLGELGVDGVEISRGSYYSFRMVQGDVPLNELARALPAWMRPFAKLKFRRAVAANRFEEHFNLPLARIVKPALGAVPLLLVGGMRRLAEMERLLEEGEAELISLCRPLIREPTLVRRFRQGKTTEASCEFCNKCLAAVFNGLPVRCYSRGLPRS